MKFVCNGTDLSDALSKVIKALPSKKSMPILEGIKFSAFGDTLTIMATDIDFVVIIKIKADIIMEGEVLVQGRTICEYIRKISKENYIEFDTQVENDKLYISHCDSFIYLATMNLSEYPAIEEIKYDMNISIKQKDFKDLVNKTIFATSTEDIRQQLKGCLLSVKKNVVKSVGLDGYRLAICNKQLEEEYQDKEIIVPAKNLSEIAKLLENDDENISISINDKKMMVEFENSKVITSLIAGQYIKYESTIPTHFETEITVDRASLEYSMDKVDVIAKQDKNNYIKMDIKEGKMTIYCNTALSNIKEVINTFTKGKDVTVSLNAKYLTDCIKNSSDEYLSIKISNSNNPIVITPIESDEYLYLILPIRTR
ncbi:MAG: DNA polymerase III subunit beta [Clostridia bacterium]|nr:DNA polymerase III subunit beta [Clostridia bacterium]